MARRIPLHERVKARCEAAGLTSAVIEAKTGWHELRVWRLFNGKTKLSAEDVETLAKIIGCPPGELYLDPPKARASAS